MRTIITTLNEFARENSFLSVIILAIIANIATDIFKKISFFFITNLSRKTNKWHQKNIRFLIDHYQKELERVEKIKHKDLGELYELLETLYSNVIVLFITITVFLVINKFNSYLWFYAFLGSGAWTMFKVIWETIYSYNLILKSQKFENYRNKMSTKISRLQTSIKD